MKAIQGLNLLAHTDDFTIKDYMSIINDLIDCLEYKISHCQSFGDNISNKKAEKEFLKELGSFKSTLFSFDLDMNIRRENEDEELKKFYKELKDKELENKNFKKASKEKIKEISERLGI
ncbi:hypothetical protein [Campylobacter phage CJLB-10]|nr:hypothetical protein [Campylobacter phage CJLB-10]